MVLYQTGASKWTLISFSNGSMYQYGFYPDRNGVPVSIFWSSYLCTIYRYLEPLCVRVPDAVRAAGEDVALRRRVLRDCARFMGPKGPSTSMVHA